MYVWQKQHHSLHIIGTHSPFLPFLLRYVHKYTEISNFHLGIAYFSIETLIALSTNKAMLENIKKENEDKTKPQHATV